MFRGSQLWRHNVDLMASVPGVGPAISRTLMAELPELGMLDRSQVATLVDDAPFTRGSGEWRGADRIDDSRTDPRAVLVRGAMVAAKH